MEKITVPIVPLSNEDKVVRRILKFSAEEFEEKCVLDFKEDDFSEIKLVLLGIRMEKYIDHFVKSKITLDIFLQLDETDLRELGITDTEDIKIIIKNIQNYEARRKKLSVPDSPNHDLLIAKNVRNELILLQNYCSYLELQMRKHKLTDYRISWKESASTYLKAFAESALLQARILSQRVFNDSGDKHLIGKALKLNNLTLTNHLKEKLERKKPKRRQRILYVVLILGIISLAAVKKFLN